MIFAGVDAGSRMTKIVLWDHDHHTVAASGSIPSPVDHAEAAQRLLRQLLDTAHLPREAVTATIATGYGRNLIDFATTTVTEITCHARGARHLDPQTTALIEIGGQDSKLIRLDPQGHVRDFNMNDRCAAGTGRFLEMLATRLNLALDQLGPLARQSTQPAPVSSMCVVFAETEIIGLLASGRPPADVIAGVQTSIATRVAGMAGRQLEGPVRFTGGVALVPGMSEALSQALRLPVTVLPMPLFTGALGAALLAVPHA
jgi:(R)-2-hydroxyacyl-CoA dehydratese activating ATPase